MVKFVKYDKPTEKFQYPIKHRLTLLSQPRLTYSDTGEKMPPLTAQGVRTSALIGPTHETYVNDIAYPYVRRVVLLKKMYKRMFSPTRVKRIDKLLLETNATCYSKLANCQLDPKKAAENLKKKKKPWTDSDWKKHMDLIAPLATPRKNVEPPPIDRGPRKSLDELKIRAEKLAALPEYKIFRRLSQDPMYEIAP